MWSIVVNSKIINHPPNHIFYRWYSKHHPQMIDLLYTGFSTSVELEICRRVGTVISNKLN